jgi:outer membrane translocation and assembly module TamA
MSPRGLLPVVPLFVVCIPSAFGQLPKRLEKCLPYPTLAQEIREMQPAQPAPTRVKMYVIRVDFDPNDGIPPDAQEEISEELRRRSRVFEPDADSAYLKDLANEIAEVSVRGALRGRGYFNAAATAKLTPLQTEGADISVVVTISATPGPQYRTGDIRIESTDGKPLAISPEILRSLIPIHRGELFSTARIRVGLENLGRAYGREGYLDMTPEPDTEVDDAHRTIDLVVKIDQQVQYRVGSIELLGVNAVTREKLMESLPKPGEVFDTTKLDEFFKVNRTILPPDASRDDVKVERHNNMRTVRILFDLRECPQYSN